jgi:hypothetical protein
LKDIVAAVKLHFIIFYFSFHFFNLFSLSLSRSPLLPQEDHTSTATKALCSPRLRPRQLWSRKAPALRDEGVVSAKAPIRPALVQEGSAMAQLCATKVLCPPRLRSDHRYQKAHTHQEICRDLV